METKQAQPQVETGTGMNKKEALDILYKIAAERKAEIARGEYFTLEECMAMSELHFNKLAEEGYKE